MPKKGFKSILTRSITGVVFVAIIIGALLFHSFAAFVVLGVAMYFTFIEYLSITIGHTANKRYVGLLKLNVMIFYALSYVYARGQLAISPLFWPAPFLIILAISELYNKEGNTFQNTSTAIMGLIYIILPFSLTNIMLNDGAEYNSLILLAVFILIWINDSFAYLFGISLGKHRMWERISPKKSWEGFIGGGLSTIILSAVIARLFFTELFTEMMGLAIIVIIFGTFGDLFESKIKRQYEVKDSGTALPGHGGFLDRFDSFLFIIPIAMIYLQLIA